MGHMRTKPKLLPSKLLAIREFLNISQAEMASRLQSDILANTGRDYTIQAARTSDYETGRREPNLFVLMAYARLGSIHLELLADDRFTVEEVRSNLGKQCNHGLRQKKRKSQSAPASLHTLTRLPTNFEAQSVDAPTGPYFVCRYCKTPICAAICPHCKDLLYDANGSVCYLHTNNGITTCDTPQVQALPNRATPYDDNETYVAYRADLITEMTNCMFSYMEVERSPSQLLENVLADLRHYADANGLPFDEHERRSYQLYLENTSGGTTLAAR